MPAERDARVAPDDAPPQRDGVALRKARVRAALAVVAAIALLGTFVAWIGPAQIAATLRDVRWPPLLLAGACIAAGSLLGAFNAWQLGQLGAHVRFPRFVAAFWCGWAAGLVVPGQVADVLLLTGLLRRLGVSGSLALGRLGVDKLLSLVVVMLAIAALPLATGVDALLPLVPVAGIAALALLAAPLLADALVRRFAADTHAPSWRTRIAAVVQRAGERFRHSPGRVFANLVLSIVKLGLAGASYWLVFAALGIDPPAPWRVAVVAAAAGLVAYVPVSLNGIGTVELAGVLLFGFLGIEAPVVASAYILLRVLNLLIAWLPVGLAAPVALRGAR
ncbi:MAG TPA: lysylphosphatidylglycerol synthase transmembrane domain-containing protein [Xanthomonadales bacterium]|nr:lysylphosphatidylglycerol synthase transmembrane domain-containing protein [Xanthomonadales bacterium]